MYEASSEHRKDTVPATSSGSPIRRTAIVAATPALKSSNETPMRSAVAAVIAVAMKPQIFYSIPASLGTSFTKMELAKFDLVLRYAYEGRVRELINTPSRAWEPFAARA